MQDHRVTIYQPDHTMILHSISEKLVSSMTVHYLDILATFRQKAEQEDIGAEEQIATVADSMVDLFPILAGLDTRLVVRTLDELATLAALLLDYMALAMLKHLSRHSTGSMLYRRNTQGSLLKSI